MKVIAMYLPQFHSVRENDEWWGKGFTDWSAAKKAKPLFENHDQPHIPLNDFYYDLLDKDTMEWQAELMHKYSIDGLCIYHYWFKDGRQILEKPAENLLKWSDIDMPYCFCWANETWARSWSNIAVKNVWADVYEKEKSGKGVLLEQKYGAEAEWTQHFNYLLPFFRDKRYIKVDGKPVFVIYRTNQIQVLGDMRRLWDELARKNGLSGIYMIGSKTDYITRNLVDAELNIEPNKGLSYLEPLLYDNCKISNYDDVWNSILLEIPMKESTYFGGFVNYDDTPRRGKNGNVIRNASPEKFGRFLSDLMAKNKAYGKDIVFLNAWNEWGEGMYLEPDDKMQYQYLEKIKYAKEHYPMQLARYRLQKDVYCNKKMQISLKEKEKYENYFNLFDQWMTLRERGIYLNQYLLKKGYQNIAIYGYGSLGKHLLNELRDTEITVSYMIDQQKKDSVESVKCYKPDANLPKVDAIIVSAVYYMYEILERFRDKGIDMPLISLKTMIDEAGKL